MWIQKREKNYFRNGEKNTVEMSKNAEKHLKRK